MSTTGLGFCGQRNHALVSGVGALAIVATIALASPASAKVRHQPEPKPAERVNKGPFGDVPKGPSQIIVSINQQKLHLYSDGKEVGETSVATGVPQLPTPTGVFSVIQKQKFHRSNIYSGAPMPFMQRITWSGVAIHEGENIGHPASHGCIRMPHDFAVRLYDFTKMGVRVIVAREELKPVDIADSHLFVHKAAPPPPAPAPEAAATPAPTTPATTDVTPVADPTKTADAGATAKTDAPAVAAAASPAAAPSATPADASKATDAGTPPQAQAAPPVVPAPTPTEDATKPADATAPGGEAKVADAVTPPPAEAAAPDAAPAAPATTTAPEATKPAPAGGIKATDAAPPSMPQPAAPIPTEQLRGTLTGGTAPDAADTAVPLPSAPAAKPSSLIETAAATRGPISIFISRKTQKLYVRQNFAPLFEAPITIAQPDQPVGTLVFTAMNYLGDGATFRWNVVTFPGEPPRIKRVVETRRGRRTVEESVKTAGTLAPPQAPADVLARIQIPQDVLDRVSELMVPGSSLVVSDQGLGDETGEGTDFIVVTR